MAGLKALGLLLIFGCLAVSAEIQEQKQNKTDDVPRAVSEQDVRLLWNPLISQILAAKAPPVKPPPPHRDPPHYHHHYPYYYNPYYAYYPYPYPPHHDYTTTPRPSTTTTTRMPTTTTPPPNNELRVPIYNPGPYPYNPYIPPNGYYPQYPGQPPVIVIVSPTTPAPPTGGGTGGNNAGAGTGAGTGGNNAGAGTGAGTGGINAGAGTGAGNGANINAGINVGVDPGVRYTLYPRAQTEHTEEDAQYDYVDMSARNMHHDAVSVVASDSDEEKDKDTFIVDTKDIKLPFGITINSSSGSTSDKKNKEQEALIYLRNYKKGRQLPDVESA